MDEVLIELSYRKPPQPRCPTCRASEYVRDDHTFLYECGYETHHGIIVNDCQKNKRREERWDSWCGDYDYQAYD